MLTSSRHTFEEHVGELRLRVDAGSLNETFAEAARALARLLEPGGKLPRPNGERETVELKARDRAALLVDWLNELLYRSETRRRIFVEYQFENLSDTELRAVVRGVPVEELRTMVKAATLHDLELKEQPDGYFATVVLDI